MLDKNELRSIIKDNCVIILDTNCFLELYRYSASASRAVEYVLDELMDKIWIPHHIYEEYLDNHEKVKSEQYNKYKVIEKNLTSEADKMLRGVNNYFNQYKKYRYPKYVKNTEKDIIVKVKEIKEILAELGETLKKDDEQNKNMLQNDRPLNFIKELKKFHQIGDPFTISEKIEIYKEGEIRYKLNIPPGYKDSNKDDNSKENNSIKVYGDLVVWKSILKYAKENNRLNNIIFITNDIKSDWWESFDKKSDLVPRKELVQEFKEHSNGKLTMYTLNDFISTYADRANLDKKAIIELDATKMVLEFFENNEFDDFIEMDEQYIAELIDDGVNVKILSFQFSSLNIEYLEIELASNEVKAIGTVVLLMYVDLVNATDDVVANYVEIVLNGFLEIDFSVMESPANHKSTYYIEHCSRLQCPVLDITEIEPYI